MPFLFLLLREVVLLLFMRQLQVLIMVFNKKTLVNIPTQRTHHETFWVLCPKLMLMNVSSTVFGIVLVFLWFQIIGKRIKTLGFHNNTIKHPEPCQTYKMEHFWKLFNVFYRLTIFKKRCILDICSILHKFSIGIHTNKRMTLFLKRVFR